MSGIMLMVCPACSGHGVKHYSPVVHSVCVWCNGIGVSSIYTSIQYVQQRIERIERDRRAIAARNN